MSDQNKPKIYFQVFESAEFADFNYWLEVILSIGIAILGLIINSPAVVIGAMLISPLMGPIIATGLAIALGDFYLGFKATTNVVLSILVSISFAALITAVLPFRTATPEILARIQPTILDLAIAILSGMAGAIVVCRGARGGGVTALPGVAIAVALMPPLAVVGFGVGIGWDWPIIRGGSLLFVTNLVAIVLSSFLVFFSMRMDTAAVSARITEWQGEKEKSDHFYAVIQKTPLTRLLGNVGTLPRRVLILLAFLALVSYPLQRSLIRLSSEASIRHTIVTDLRQLIPPESIVQEEVEISSDNVRVRVVTVLPEGVPDGTNQRLEQMIQTATGRRADVAVYNVATREDLSALSGRLSARAAPVLQSVDEMRADLLSRINSAVSSTWPAAQAPLLGYSLTMDSNQAAPSVEITFIAQQDIGPFGEEAIRKGLRDRMGLPSLGVTFMRVPASWTLHFAARKSALTPQHMAALDELAAVLKKFPKAGCDIVLAAGLSGREADISKLRAQNVQEYLVQTGQIPAAQIQTIEKGDASADVILSFRPPAN
ncbi:MAG TPA: TIGR00341 family protein [Candidatus Dormibacteraeota bacterium]|nr:TIGR00341 family protein [Candidatus Dormibacteraeota bacterium]